MEMPIVEYRNIRVLTTALIAEQYGAEEKQIHDNFANNRQRYEEGRHYFCLQGEALRAFKELPENIGIVSKNAPVLYLWTEKGALLHAKSLNTDRAWEIYDKLVEEYFRSAVIKVQDSYMIADPVKRAERWIAEYQEKKALEQTVAVQKVQIEEQQETIEVQTEQIEVMTPKADYCDTVLNSPDLLCVTEICKDYGMGAAKFNQKLKELGIQYKQGSIWVLYSKYENQGYTRTKTVPFSGGKMKPQTYWTQKGRMFLYEKLKEKGILPKSEQKKV